MRTISSSSGRARRVAAFTVVVLLTLGLAACGDDDATDETTETTQTTQTTQTTETTIAPLAPDVVAFALWPDATGETRFDDPVEAARSFAVDLIGFSDPVLGTFQQGDSRSGEVELRPHAAEGPSSTVLLRQLTDDDSWWVIGAVHADIVIDDPQPQSAVDAPLQLSGEARAFEGTVQVAIYADGSTESIGDGFVTGSGGPELGPFEGEIPFEAPQGGWGALVLYLDSAPDGEILAVSAVRIGFIGGD